MARRRVPDTSVNEILPGAVHIVGHPGAAARRRHARDIIDAVVANMRHNLERLKYSTLAPSHYTVYLHPREFERLETIVPVLQEQTIRALDEELRRLNAASATRRWMRRMAGEREAEIRNAATDWHIAFLADPDEELQEGDLFVDSELLIPARPDLGLGEQPRKIVTRQEAQGATRIEHTVACSAAASRPRLLARIEYDDGSGHHFYDVTRDSISIGRGGVAYPVDVRVVAPADVSREHARIRRDSVGDRFFLIDLSTLGTTVNGCRVAPGFDEVDGSKRENGSETLLPEVATIGLAGTVFLDFRKRR
jgi:pSer/pThr/pTyr-binding forkhead associated (FHA) protein